MENAIGKVVSIVMLVFAGVFLPLILILQKEEKISQACIETITTEFVDNARGTGRISASEYERMYSEIGHFVDCAEVLITHSSKVEGYNGSEVITYYIDFNGSEILDVIYKDPTKPTDYRLRNGDKLSVTVKNGHQTKATRLLSVIFPSLPETTIYYQYTGSVGNNAEEN